MIRNERIYFLCDCRMGAYIVSRHPKADTESIQRSARERTLYYLTTLSLPFPVISSAIPKVVLDYLRTRTLTLGRLHRSPLHIFLLSGVKVELPPFQSLVVQIFQISFSSPHSSPTSQPNCNLFASIQISPAPKYSG